MAWPQVCKIVKLFTTIQSKKISCDSTRAETEQKKVHVRRMGKFKIRKPKLLQQFCNLRNVNVWIEWIYQNLVKCDNLLLIVSFPGSRAFHVCMLKCIWIWDVLEMAWDGMSDGGSRKQNRCDIILSIFSM